MRYRVNGCIIIRVGATLSIVLAVIAWSIPKTDAAVSLVQATSTNSGTSPVSLSFSTTPTAGNLLVAICSADAAATISAPSGFSTVINESSDPAQAIFYKVSVGNETSISCGFSAGGDMAIQIYNYSGIENVTPLDAYNTSTSSGSTTPASTGSVSTNNASDLLIGAVTSDASSGIASWTNSFVQETATTSGGKPSTRLDAASADLSVSSSGSYSSLPAVQSGSNWRGQIAAFKIAPAASFGADIVNSSGVSVSSPSVSMSAMSYAFACQTSTGTLGSASQKIRVTNTTPADSNGWNLTIGASSADWSDGAGHTYAYNNSAGSPAGCTSGQLTINPTAATITPESSPEYGCTNTGVSAYTASTAFTGSTPATIIQASPSSSHYCYWDITGITLSQTIPPVQPSGTYSINFTITLTAL